MFCDEMSNRQKEKVYKFNLQRRENLIKYLDTLDTTIDKVRFVVDYFTNRLPKEVVSKIDKVDESVVLDFEYDYSFINGKDTKYPRRQICRAYPDGFGITLGSIGQDYEIDDITKPEVYPTLFALKMGTCIMFANEIQRIMYLLGVESRIVVSNNQDMYDCYDGHDIEFNKISVDEIRKFTHYFNVVKIDGKEYKVDVAGYLTANDYNLNHFKDGQIIDLSQFYFSEDLYNNPFENIGNIKE